MKNIFILFWILMFAGFQSLAQADFTPTTTCGSGSVTFNNSTPGYSSPTWTSSWDFGDGNTSTSDSPTHVFATAGIYSVSLTVTAPGPVVTNKTMSVLVPAIPAFNYASTSVCMSSTTAPGISPSSNFTGLNGTFSSTPAGLESGLDPATGNITYSSNIPTFVYQISYSYDVPGCGTLVSTSAGINNLGLGYAKSGPISGGAVAGYCNRIRLTIDPNAKGSLQWQVFTTVTGTWVNLPSTGEGPPIGILVTNANNASNKDQYVTPTLTVTSQVRAVLSDPVCGTLYSDNTLPFIIRGVSTPGTASSSTPIICRNTSPTLTLTGYLGAVQWQISTDNVSWTNATGGSNPTVAQVFPAAPYTVHVPGPISTIGNVFFRAAVQFVEYGSNCLITYSNVITVSSEFCTVTSQIITPSSVTSNICSNQATIQFTDNSFPSGSSVATITSWNWSFQNGTPASSSARNPPSVTFPTATTNVTDLVSLTVTGPGGTSSVATFLLTIDGITNLSGISPSGNFTLCGGNLLTLTGQSTNANPVFQWYNSPDNVAYNPISPGGSGRTFVTPIITSNIYYKVSAQNGVCPGITTTGTSVTLIPALTISPNFNTPDIITFCEGQRAVITAAGINGTISFEMSTVAGGGGPYSPLAGVNLIATNTYQTPYFLIAGTRYIRAVIQNTFNCNPATSGFYTISVTSCAVQPLISVTSAYLSQRTCRDSPVFYFADNTPTVAGISLTGWNWDFGVNASPASATGPNPGAVTYSGSADIFPTVTLSVSGTSGSITTIYTRSIVLTIDGLSTAMGINTLSGSPLICKNNTASLTLSGANPNANFQWEGSTVSSISGWASLGATNSSFYTTVPLLNSQYYRTLITNGVCPTYTTPGILVNVVPDVTISPLTPTSISKCTGESTSLSVIASNGNVTWQESPDGIAAWTNVTAGSGFNTSNFTTTYLYATKYYRASVSDPLGCLTSLSGVFTVSIGACPINPVISVTSPLLFQRTCYDQPNFSFQDVTPAITGVTYVKAAWNFDNQANVTSLSTVPGAPPFPVTYTQLNQLRDIQTVRLTITGVSGNYTFTGTSFVNVTIDGLPTITGFVSTSNDLCNNNTGTTLLADPSSNPVISSPFIRWYVSSAPGVPYAEILPRPPSGIYSTPPLTTTTSYIMTADNGACSTFTTPVITIRVYEKTTISGFSYPTPLCNSNTSVVSPVIVRSGNTVPGIFYVSSSNSNQVTVDPLTGALTPVTTLFPSNVSETFTINYSVPGMGQCTSPPVVPFDVQIGKQLPTPVFGYSNSPYCSNQILASRIYNFGEGSYPWYYSSSDITVNSTTGVVDLQSITSGADTARINFIIPKIAGCTSLLGTTLITVTSAPAVGDFAYPNANSNYCSDEGVITPNLIGTFDPLGYWSISPNSGISISSTTGVVTLTGSTLTDLYTIVFTNPARGGCYFSATRQHAIFVYQLPAQPVFYYGSVPGIPDYCSSSNNIPLPTKVSGDFTLGQFVTTDSDINLNASNGKITVPNNTISGIKDIKYVISGIGPCASRTIEGLAQINLIAVPEPSFMYDRLYLCNDLTSYVNPINLKEVSTVGGGTFYPSTTNANFISVDATTGVISVTPVTPPGNYNIYYRTPLPAVCGLGDDIISKNPASFTIEQVLPVPVFSYGDHPFCSGISRQPITTLTSGLYTQYTMFYAPSAAFGEPGSSINNLGELYPLDNPVDGIYTITAINTGKISINNVITTTCPVKTGITVVTVSSHVSIPPFNYGNQYFCSDDIAPKTVVGLSLISGAHFFSNPDGLLLNTLSGVITINGSSISGSDSTAYQIVYQIDGQLGCDNVTQSSDIIINRKQIQPSIFYPKYDYCQNEGKIRPTSASQFLKGTFSAAFDIAIDSISGEINLGKSAERSNIIIKYDVNANGACKALFDTASISITYPLQKDLSYGDTTGTSYTYLCKLGGPQLAPPIVNLPKQGTFSGSTSLYITSFSGIIDVEKTPVGTYTVKYSYGAHGPCPADFAELGVVISEPIAKPEFDYEGSPYCKSGQVFPSHPKFDKGAFTASKSGIDINSITGAINLTNSRPADSVIITYTVPVINGCPILTTSDTISIVIAKIGQIYSDQQKGLICGGESATLHLEGSYFGDITWEQRSYSSGLWVQAKGTKDNDKFYTEGLVDTTYFRAHAQFLNCADSAYTNQIKIQVIPPSNGGTATTIDNERYVEICGVQSYRLKLANSVGDITWLYSTDTVKADYTDQSLMWDEVDPANHDKLFDTPNQNGRGLKIWYKAKVVNQNCRADSSNSVLVEVCSAGVDVPNALTPASGDDTQSRWDLTRLKLVNGDNVKVFNRYGSKVFESNGGDMNVLEKCWDGGGLPMGAYYYLIVFADQKIKNLVGTVSIIR